MGVSDGATFLKAQYQDWVARMSADPEMPISMLRCLFDEWSHATREPENVFYQSVILSGVEAIKVMPQNADPAKAILYSHGGGFATGSASSHRKLAGHLAKTLNAVAYVTDYRRAPEHPYPAQIEDSLAVYKQLLKTGYQPENIVLAGDSAGGNLSISSALKIRDLSMPLPGAIIMFSPWLDLEMKGASFASNADTDALVSKVILEAMAGMYLGQDGVRSDPYANPACADLSGLPRIYINVGGDETLRSDSEDFHARAKAEGTDSTLSVVEGMQHVFPLLAGRAPEVDEEMKRISDWFFAD